MKQIVVYTSLLVSVFLVACASRSVTAPADGEPVFTVTLQNSDDEVQLQLEDDTTVIEIQSPSGIGSAQFQLESGQLPERIVARLHLKGLEEVRLVTEVVTVIASGSGGGAQSQRILSGNSEQALAESDALWLNIQIVPESAKLPLEDGYFEVHFPEAFVEQSGGTFEIRWIDFFSAIQGG